MIPTRITGLELRDACPDDLPLLLSFIRELAEYEGLAHEVQADETGLGRSLFGPRPVAEALIADYRGEPAAFVLFFHNFSTFMGQPGLYLEDLYVRPRFRNLGIGRVLLEYLARLALERGCGRFEWSVLDWNAPAIGFYRKLGAVAMDQWTVQRVSGPALETLAAGFGERYGS